MASRIPLYRGQGNQPFVTADARGAAKRGQTVPYDINGAPPSTPPTADPMVVTFEAGEALGGHRAVYIADDDLAYHANPNATARFTIGVTTGSASLGTDTEIQCDGVMTELSWSWAGTEVVWLAANGQLTQVVPTTGTAFQVGVPAGPTSLRLEPEVIAKLS